MTGIHVIRNQQIDGTFHADCSCGEFSVASTHWPKVQEEQMLHKRSTYRRAEA